MANKSKTSKKWLSEHFNDEYVKKSWADGFRSRAAYKLLEIQEKDKLIKPGMTVIDLGAAPGGWSQVAKRFVGKSGLVIASDILAMDHIPDVTFLQGDFTQDEVYQELLKILDGRKVDLVISDMAPNLSGNKALDQPRSMYLVELALDFAQQVLKSGGGFVAKIFQGVGFDEILFKMRRDFSKVISRKPDASRDRSKEVYLVGLGLKR